MIWNGDSSGGGSAHRDLDDEIAHDFAVDVEERVRAGMPRDEAEYASRRDFGNVPLLQEGMREMWGSSAWHWARNGDASSGWCLGKCWRWPR